MTLAFAAAGALLVTMIVLLVMQLVVLRDSREHIVAQDRKVNRLVKGTDPALESLPPALDELRPAAAEARRALREARPLIGRLVPLADLGYFAPCVSL